MVLTLTDLQQEYHFGLNRFRKLGFIDFNGRILVDKSLLNVVLYDDLPERNTGKLTLFREPTRRPRSVE
jgi:CRP/FNR family cyclic AMP-dependent transcriptional regulator